MAVNLSAGVKAKLANAKLAQAGSSVTVPVPATQATPATNTVTPQQSNVSPTPVTPTPAVSTVKGVQVQQGGTQQPTAVTPTPTAKTDTVQPSVSPDFQDNSDKRLKEIQMNLDKYAKSNPEMFANQQTYRGAFSYDKRSQEQKAVLDSFFQSQQAKNQAVQQQQAQANLQQKMLTDLQTMPIQQMVETGLSNEQTALLVNNFPERYAEYQKARDDKIKLDAINAKGSKLEENIAKIAENFMNSTIEVPQLSSLYAERMKELEPAQTELNQKKGELQTMEDEMDNILNDARKELEGTGATDSYIRALASKRMQEITPLYNAKLREYNVLLDDYKTKASNIEQELAFTKEQFQLDQSARQQQMQQLGFAMDLMSFETPQAKADREWNDFVKKQTFMEGDINSTDKAVRDRAITKAANEFVASYQGLVKSTPTQIAERIKKDMNNGKSYADAMNSIMEDLKQNKNYNDYMNARAGVQSNKKSVVTINGKEYFMDKDGNITNIEVPSDIDLKKGVSGKQASNLILSGGIDTLASIMDEGVGYNAGNRGQCGEWYNDAVGTANGTAVGDTYESKTKFVDQSITEGQPGMGVVYNFGGKYEREGHIGILASGLTSKNGVMGYYVISANAKGDEKLSKDFVPEGLIAGSRGGFIPTKVQASEGVKTYTNEQKNIVKGMDINNLSKIELNVLAKNGLSEVDAYQIKAEQSASGESPEAIKEITGLRKEFNALPEVKNFRTAQSQMNIIESAANQDTAAADLSMIFAYMKMLDPASTVREGEFANAQNAASVPDRIRNMYNNVTKGTRLNKDQRQMFKNGAQSVYRSYVDVYNQRLSEYKGYITAGGNPDSIGTEVKTFTW